MKRILQAMDGVATEPVAGVNDMSKFLTIIDKNDVEILKEEVNNNTVLNEGANPHKVSLPVQMAMQHYQSTGKSVSNPSLLKKYFQEVEQKTEQAVTEKKQLLRQYASHIAERVLMKEGAVSQFVKKGTQSLLPGVERPGQFTTTVNNLKQFQPYVKQASRTQFPQALGGKLIPRVVNLQDGNVKYIFNRVRGDDTNVLASVIWNPKTQKVVGQYIEQSKLTPEEQQYVNAWVQNNLYSKPWNPNIVPSIVHEAQVAHHAHKSLKDDDFNYSGNNSDALAIIQRARQLTGGSAKNDLEALTVYINHLGHIAKRNSDMLSADHKKIEELFKIIQNQEKRFRELPAPNATNTVANYNQAQQIQKDTDQALQNVHKISHDAEKNPLNEKSTSEKQARTMAAAAHNPEFAKKLGIKSSVAKEFNKADTGTKQLSNAMKHKKKKVKENEIPGHSMGFTGGVGPGIQSNEPMEDSESTMHPTKRYRMMRRINKRTGYDLSHLELASDEELHQMYKELGLRENHSLK
jgi:hypothetical protein